MNDLKQSKRNTIQKKISKFLKNQNKQYLSNYVVHYLKYFQWPKYFKIALYDPLNYEVDIRPLIKFYPYLHWFYPCDQDLQFISTNVELKKSKKCFFKPIAGACCSACDIDVFMIPALAFDRNFGRLGRGAGFYDKTLSFAKENALKIGISWSMQISEFFLPQSSNDISMDAIVTENWGIYSQNFFKKYEKTK